MTEIQRSGSDGVIRDASNQAEMIEKLQAQEKRALQRVLEKHKVETRDELSELASKEIVTRALKFTGGHASVDHDQVLKEPKSREVNELRSAIGEEIRAIGQRTIQALHGTPNQSTAD